MGEITQKIEPSGVDFQFQRIETGFLPISIFQCAASADGETQWGFAESLSPLLARKRARSEAWERWVFRKFSAKWKTTNGIAAHENLEYAKRASLEELTERAWVLSAWRERRGWIRKGLSSPLAKVQKAFLEFKGWNVDIYSIGPVTAALARHSSLGALFDSQFGTTTRSESKVMGSLLRMHLLRTQFSLGGTEVGGPGERFAYYADPDHLAAFQFIDEPQLPLVLPSAGMLEMEIVENEVGLPFVVRTTASNWPVLEWDTDSLGENTWPHPIA